MEEYRSHFQLSPYGDPGRQYYPVLATYVILGVNVLVFILMTLAGGSKNIQVLLDFGASYGPLFRAGEYWRLVMPMFLHIGLAHLLTNMTGLVLLGYFLEPLYGYGRFSLLYVVSGIAGSLLSMEASPHIAAGASGAIFGIAGAMLVTGILHPEAVPYRWKNVFGIGILLVIIANLVFGHFVKHIDNWAHLGGLISGVALAWIIPPARSGRAARTRNSSRSQSVPAFLVAILVLAAMGVTANHYVRTGEAVKLLGASAKMQAAHHTGHALALAQQALRIAPHDIQAHEAVGALYLEKGEYAPAIRELREALRFDPFSPAGSVELAAAYEGLGNLTQARQVLEAAYQKTPRDIGTQEALAEVCTKLALYAEAVQHYNRMLRQAPKDSVAQNNLAWLLATCSDPRYRDPKAALEHALAAVKLTQWQAPDFIDTLAAALFANRRFKLAAEVEKKALQMEPGNISFRASWDRYRQAAKL
ncbi:MAG: rhomboid family intramembrane serine protease [Terriglobia bacterium]